MSIHLTRAIHLKRDSKGRVVTILEPSQATEASTWADAQRVATATPGSAIPVSINGIKVTHPIAPVGPQGWEKLVVDRGVLASSPLQLKPGKKASAGAVVLEPDGRVWLVEPTNRFWGYERTFPKGANESGYSLSATAAKEVFEETGLLVEIGPLLIDVERTNSICRFFIGYRVGGDPSEMGWESQAVCLVPLRLLSEMLKSKYDYDTRVLLALQNRSDIWPFKDPLSRMEEMRSR